MDKQIAFKKQLFGFSKKMVIDFIGDAYQQSAAEEERLGRQIRELTAENERLVQQAQKDSAAMAIVQERASTEAANALRMAEAVKTLTAEINRQKLDQNQKDYKIKQLTDRLEEYAAKEREAGELQKQSEAILEAARKEAEEIKKQSEIDLEAAKREAEELIKQSENALEAARREAEELKKRSESALEIAYRENEDLRRRKDGVLDVARKEAEEIIAKAKKQRDELMGGAQEEHERLQAGIRLFRTDIGRLKAELRKVIKEIGEKVDGFEYVVESDGKPSFYMIEKKSEPDHSSPQVFWEKPVIQEKQDAPERTEPPVSREIEPFGIQESPSLGQTLHTEDKPIAEEKPEIHEKPVSSYSTPGGFFRPAAQR